MTGIDKEGTSGCPTPIRGAMSLFETTTDASREVFTSLVKNPFNETSTTMDLSVDLIKFVE